MPCYGLSALDSLPPASSLLPRVAAALLPPERMSLADWADRYRHLSSEASAAPGAWTTLPYQREVLEALSPHSRYAQVVLMWGSQLGKTEMLLTLIAYIIAMQPGPILVVQPTLSMAEAFSKDRISPMIRDMEILRGLVADPKARDAGSTIFHRRFVGGHLTIVGSNSPAGLASRPVRYLLMDELDRWEASAGAEGDPAALAQVRSAQAAYTDAEAQYKRIAAVFARKLVSRAQYDQSRASADAAKAALDAAQQNYRAAQQSQAYTVVRAPYAGIVTQRFVQVGEAVQPGTPLIAGISLNQLRVEAQVPQSDVDAIRKYARAWLLYDHGSKRLEAAKVIVFPYADPTTHTFTVRLELPPADTGLNPGEVVQVAFMVGSRPRLLIPDSSVMRRGEITGVYVVRAGQVSLRQVRLGHRFGDEVEVISGLTAGEQIATDPLRAVAWLVKQHAAKGV